MNRPAEKSGLLKGGQNSQIVKTSFILTALVLLAIAPRSAAAQEEAATPLITEVHNTLNQVIVRWESDPTTPLSEYALYRAPEGVDQWEEVVSCEYFEDKTFYAYRDLKVGKHDKIRYRLEATDLEGNRIKYTQIAAQLTPYNQRLSYKIDMEKQTISFFGGFLEASSTVTLMDLQGSRFEFPISLVGDQLTMDAIELPDGKYTYTVASGNKRRSGNVQYDRQLLENVPGAFAFTPSRDE